MLETANEKKVLSLMLLLVVACQQGKQLSQNEFGKPSPLAEMQARGVAHAMW